MITIKYDHDTHRTERITEFLDIKVTANHKFIISAIELLKKDNAEIYMVSHRNKISLCRKGLTPVITEHPERYQFFALKNKQGRIIVAGKNSRKIESIIPVLKSMTKNNPIKQHILNKNLTVKERCTLVNYELLKQDKPF